MAALVNMPVYMRLGGSAEVEVGRIEIPVSGDGTIDFDRAQFAAMLRSAADAYETPEQEDD
ncbi:hypothetical protein Q5762_07420 [Streptomyces sp. P9(2023)]|uniref:hypothetical protein n=1 Tax=Streptomyces sp. P9(2023) TaxID=3064394 RepID=UPI0028F3E57F|nr:hypothetical protein [Streptomyces sp. P9(2023)]MDT9688186.1 hypothetical protein [Streptomyces sp. P9(2023)]